MPAPGPLHRAGHLLVLLAGGVLEAGVRAEERRWGDGRPCHAALQDHPAATCPALLILLRGGSAVTLACVLGPLHNQQLPSLSYGCLHPCRFNVSPGHNCYCTNHVQFVLSLEQIPVCLKPHLPILSYCSPPFYSVLSCLLSKRSDLLPPENINRICCAGVVAFLLSCIFPL